MTEKKFKYIAEYKGEIFTRTSPRTYTHIVIGKWTDKEGLKQGYMAYWCGTPALAMKQARKLQNMRYQYTEPELGRTKGEPAIADIHTIPCHLSTEKK